MSSWQADVDAALPIVNRNYNPSKAYLWGLRPDKPWETVEPSLLPMDERLRLYQSEKEVLEYLEKLQKSKQ